MLYTDPAFVHTVQEVLEILGTLAFAISGIRHAAAKHYDWFGGFVCGIAVAIGGGTLRDVMLGTTPFWMTSPLYIVCTMLAQLIVIIFSRSLKRLDNAWLAFDTLGLALFTIAGIQKTLAFDYPFWVAIVMGCMTGAAGGVIRDVLLNKTPVIFKKEIYAMASIAGGGVYWLMMELGVNVGVTVATTFVVVVLIRFLALKYHISLPVLKGEEQ
ncbi:MAG: trimeric intracellular cation channel family protein [Prevotella sp.]|nr:trimeric intracellular cation channel family protein [Prevotella sp.]